jgi:hypothetical protein
MKRLFIFTLLQAIFGIFLLHAQDENLSSGEKLQRHVEKAFPHQSFKAWIYISTQDCTLALIYDRSVVKLYPISSSKNGTGNDIGSNKTPLGLHEIKKKIGKGLPTNAILKGRVYSGKKATIVKEPIATDTDLVTSRILWLSGLQPGYNQGESVDSFNRYIYIHGTPEEGLIGTHASHGCIRMLNKDVIDLFELVPEGTKVFIE